MLRRRVSERDMISRLARTEEKAVRERRRGREGEGESTFGCDEAFGLVCFLWILREAAQ